MVYREPIPLREVTTSQLGIQVLESFNLASIIGNAINFDADMKRSADILKETQAYVTTNFLKRVQDINVIPTKPAREIIKQALNDLPQMLRFAQERLRNQAIQSSAGYRLSGSMLGQQNSYWSMFNNVDFHSKILFDIPLTFAERQVRKFFNAELGLERHADRDSWVLYRNGLVKAEYILDNYRLEEGLPLEDAKNLMKIRDWQIGKPAIRDAWRWVRKGLVDKEYFYKVCQLGHGYTKKEADIIFEDFDYDLTVGDVMSLSTLIPIDSKYADKAFERAGFNETDKAIFKTALEKKTIRDEIRGIWGSLLAYYQYGLYTDQQLTDLLTSWKYTTPEINIKLETAKLYRAKLVSQLMRDADIYLYRKAVINEQELYDRLIAMGVSQDVANAITRNEACKQGNDWELPAP